MSAPLALMGIQTRLAAIVLVLVSAIALGCANQAQPSPDECNAAIVHMMEVQLDSPEYKKMMEQATAAGPGRQRLSAEQLREAAQWLESQVPSIITPQSVSQCGERV